jgi:bile acid-coenzyme A ligase
MHMRNEWLRVSIAARLDNLAAIDPRRVALAEVTAGGVVTTVTISQFAEDVRLLAGTLAESYDGLGCRAVFCHPASNSISSATTILAALQAGLPIFPHTTRFDQETLARILRAAGITGDNTLLPTGAGNTDHQLGEMVAWPDPPYPSPPTYLLASSGSTGLPKLVPFWNHREYDPRAVPDVVFRSCRWRDMTTQMMVLPLYHIAPISALLQGLLDGKTTVLCHDLEPDLIVETMERMEIEWSLLTPDYMRELLPAAQRNPERLRSLRAILHSAFACPADLKRSWLDLLGPARVYEMYGGTEGVGVTLISGSDWLARPGSVGRGVLTSVRIVDDQGIPLPANRVGRVHLRRLGARSDAIHRAALLDPDRDGFVGLGDLGWIDDDGFLYIVDRTANEVQSGDGVAWLGQISAALRSHPDVMDAECVALDPVGSVGRADGGVEEELKSGDMLCAVVVLRDDVDLDPDGLRRHCAARLVRSDDRPVPEAVAGGRLSSGAVAAGRLRFTVVPSIPRSEIGKPDRIALERLASATTKIG